MNSERPETNRIRFDLSSENPLGGPHFTSTEVAPPVGEVGEPLASAIARTRDWLLERQHDDGYWVGELEGDTILESEYALLLVFLGRERDDNVRQAANYIREQQLSTGGWAIYPGGPLEISASVKSYFTLKIVGDAADAEHMRRAKNAILAAGGVEKVNSFTRFYLALLGVIGYHQCPAVPPELMLIPRWMPFNIYEMSAWSRTILVPLSIMWAHRPVRHLPESMGIRELFINAPEVLPVAMPPSKSVDELKRKTWFDWRKMFLRVDRAFKFIDRLRIRPCRRMALKRAEKWMVDRFENSDGLGAIFPPIIWSVIALKCLGYADDSPEVESQMRELDALHIREADTLRLQPCKSPVWDTSIATIALREAGVSAEHHAIKKSVAWMLSKEVRGKGDWAVRNTGHEPAGWYFEFNNEFYPDVDDTCMVVMALRRSLPALATNGWDAEFLLREWSPHTSDNDAVAVLSGRTNSPDAVRLGIDDITPQLSAIRRGARWILAMQNRDGGWGAFDVDNTRELFTQVPFADHNAMIDPSSADLAGRMLEMFADLSVSADDPQVKRALEYVWSEQETDGSWFGRWGVNYLYGTWQTLVGLTRIGVSPLDERIRAAVDWLKSTQYENGGWGETPESYDKPNLKGQGPVTASQTAWAVMGLLAAGDVHSDAVQRGIEYLLVTQREDGTWDEPWYTGTGFPKVFYLKYHLYRIYFPLMALGRYARLKTGGETAL